MGFPEESSAKKNVFTQKCDEIRRFDGTNHIARSVNVQIQHHVARSVNVQIQHHIARSVYVQIQHHVARSESGEQVVDQ